MLLACVLHTFPMRTNSQNLYPYARNELCDNDSKASIEGGKWSKNHICNALLRNIAWDDTVWSLVQFDAAI